MQTLIHKKQLTMFLSRSNKASKAAKQQQKQAVKQEYFDNSQRTYSCIHCRAHLANHDELISKLFQGNHGRAYLFNKVVNISCKKAVERELLTGLHAVADIYCDSCETTLGWKYEQAFVPSQKYKEGKYIIELIHILKENNWDLTSYNANDLMEDKQRRLSAPEADQDGLRKEHPFTRFGARRVKKNSPIKLDMTRNASLQVLTSNPRESLVQDHSAIMIDIPNQNQASDRIAESTELHVFSFRNLRNGDSRTELFAQSEDLGTSLPMNALQSKVQPSSDTTRESRSTLDRCFVVASGSSTGEDSQNSNSSRSSSEMNTSEPENSTENSTIRRGDQSDR